jgi:hypothetical protein
MTFRIITSLKHNPRLILMLLGIVFLFYLSYKFSFIKTYDAICTVNRLNSAEENISNIDIRLEFLNKRMIHFDQILGKKDTTSLNCREAILNNITLIKTEFPAIIYDIPVKTIFKQDGYTFEINPVILEGSFHDLVRTLHILEQHREIGKIVSSKFYLKRMPISKKQKLMLAIYFQSLNYNSNEK